MMDMAKNGGQGSALAVSQGKAMLHMQMEQKHQAMMMEHAQKDMQRFWDNAFKRGR